MASEAAETARGEAHSRQNFEPGVFSAPHLEQVNAMPVFLTSDIIPSFSAYFTRAYYPGHATLSRTCGLYDE